MKKFAICLAFIVFGILGTAIGAPQLVIAQSREAMERDYVRGVVYLVMRPEQAYAKPTTDSPKVATIAAESEGLGLLVFGATEGWISVQLPKSDTFERGWIQGLKENVVKGDQLSGSLKVVHMKGKPWPPATRLDILRGIVRIGFTKEQVEIARQISIDQAESAPLKKESEETAAGITDTWTYADTIYVFSNGKVSKIKTIEK